jgi:carboxyl-terminal processing protease
MNGKKLLFLGCSLAVMLTLVSAAVFGEPTQKNSLYRYLSIFTEVFSLVRSSYVDAVPSDQLVDGAFTGVADAVDEYSYYIPPAQMARYKSFKPEDTAGLGLVVTKRYGYGYVISVLEGSAAEIAGVEAGDFIEAVNDQPTQKMAIWQFRSALDSGPGKTVDLRVLRGGMSRREDFNVARTRYDAPDPQVSWHGDIGYIRLAYFEPGTAQKFASALTRVQESGKKKLIVDVRGNASGIVDEAVKSADALLERGVITSVRGRRVEPQRWEADAQVAYTGEVQVLTDSSTAGAAEVFASAIHGNKRGKLTGIATFGYAVSQKLVPLPSGGAVYITVGHFTTPDNAPIGNEGVKPDTVVDLSSLAIDDDKPKKDEKDLILEKALENFGRPAAKAAAA